MTEHDQKRSGRVSWFVRLLDPSRIVVQAFEGQVLPAWRLVTQGESRFPVALAIGTAIAVQVLLPSRIANHPIGLFPTLAGLLLIGIVAANPTRIDGWSPVLRAATLLLTGLMSIANMASAGRLIVDLVEGEGIRNPATLILTGGAIYLTNVIVFALWYWEFDRGGPVSRALAARPYPDFLFPQMTSPELAPPGWEPSFVDYFYLSFTNATAFSPTDVMPLSRWAKMTMVVQSALSLVIAALVIARAVNIL